MQKYKKYFFLAYLLIILLYILWTLIVILVFRNDVGFKDNLRDAADLGYFLPVIVLPLLIFVPLYGILGIMYKHRNNRTTSINRPFKYTSPARYLILSFLIISGGTIAGGFLGLMSAGFVVTLLVVGDDASMDDLMYAAYGLLFGAAMGMFFAFSWLQSRSSMRMKHLTPKGRAYIKFWILFMVIVSGGVGIWGWFASKNTLEAGETEVYANSVFVDQGPSDESDETGLLSSTLMVGSDQEILSIFKRDTGLDQTYNTRPAYWVPDFRGYKNGVRIIETYEGEYYFKLYRGADTICMVQAHRVDEGPESYKLDGNCVKKLSSLQKLRINITNVEFGTNRIECFPENVCEELEFKYE